MQDELMKFDPATGDTAFHIHEAPVGEGGGTAPTAGTTAPEGRDVVIGGLHSGNYPSESWIIDDADGAPEDIRNDEA